MVFAKKKKEEPRKRAEQQAWHVLDVANVVEILKTDTEKGLTTAEAKNRLEIYGPNKLTEKRKATLLERIWRQVNNVLVGILVVVAIVAGAKAATETDTEDKVTGWAEVVLIAGVIVLNTWIGIAQEGSAERSADALKAMLSSGATVIRDGHKSEIPAEDVVIGDLVALSTGDRIPADIRLIKVANFQCQEAALTGESLPVEKISGAIPAENPMSVPLGDRKNMAFSATLVAQGESLGIVISTGDDTEIGAINALVTQVGTKKTPVLLQIDWVSKMIAAFVCLSALATFLVAFFYTGVDALESVNIALVTAVAMIPEGLAAIVTLVYAYAVMNMSKENAIVRILPAVETLGSVTVICSDKTGTLTKNEMTLVAFVTSNARYKFNTDASERTTANFVRDDEFMAHERQPDGSTKKKEDDEQKPKKNASIEPIEPESNGNGTEHTPGAGVETGDQIATPETAKVTAEEQTNPSSSNDKDKEPEGESSSMPAMGESPTFGFLQSSLSGGVLCSHCVLGENGGRQGELGNPTELAIVRAAYFAGVDYLKLRENQPIFNQVPFSSKYKFMATVHAPIEEIDGKVDEGMMVVHAKGAPDRLIPLCSHQFKGGVVSKETMEPIDKDHWLDQAQVLSSHGLRVLALARFVLPKDECGEKDSGLDEGFVNGKGEILTMIGLCAIMDPPRPECVDAIKVARGAGVRVAMITGDHKATAQAIADMLGIIDHHHPGAITGPEMDAQSDEELRKSVMKYNVFARASPENKIRIVKALQAEKQVCSMTGDGVNDAPALKAADMGVAMGKEGTDVARESAEMILADDNFATIVAAVREGRAVWDNLRKVLLFNTPVNNAQGWTVLWGMITGLPEAPLTPIQVLYCNLICAVTLGFVLAVEPPEKGIMNNPPRKPGKRIIGRFLLLRIAIGTVTLVIASVGSVWWVRSLNWPPCGPGENSTTVDCLGPDEFENRTINGEEQWVPIEKPYDIERQRAQASNTLTFGAISICLSARFAYNSGFSKQLLFGNRLCWYSVFLVIFLQLCITYIPGLNTIVFGMRGMDGRQWGIVLLMMWIVFCVMEFEKFVRRKLKSQGVDTDDEKYDLFEEEPRTIEEPYFPEDSKRSAALHNPRAERS